MREVAALLELAAPVGDQAQHLLTQALPLLGQWRRELLAASAVYAACRWVGG